MNQAQRRGSMKVFRVLLALAVSAAAQTSSRPRLFITPMQGHLDGFIAAEIIKQHIPVEVVTEPSDADIVLTGATLEHDQILHPFVGLFGSWIFWREATVKDRTEGNLRLLDVKAKRMIWAGEAGDRHLLFDEWRRGGSRKVAERLVARLARNVRFESITPATPNGYHLAKP